MTFDQRGGYWHNFYYRRLIARGEKQYWTPEDEERLAAKVRRLRERSEQATHRP